MAQLLIYSTKVFEDLMTTDSGLHGMFKSVWYIPVKEPKKQCIFK
jgi:hypothetical protein